MNYFDDYNEFDDADIEQPIRKRNSKRRWRDIESLKEKRRLSREIIRDDDKYFDMLEQYPGDSSAN
jgi:hypothetical protein